MPVVADRHACSPSLRVLDVWLVAQVVEHAVWLGQRWLRLVDSAHNSVEFYVLLPLIVDNPLGRRVAMQRVVEQVEVVGQLSMELLAYMVRWLYVDVTQTPCPIVDVSLRYSSI